MYPSERRDSGSIIRPVRSRKIHFLRTLNGLEKPTSGEHIDGMAVTSPDTDLQKVREKSGMNVPTVQSVQA